MLNAALLHCVLGAAWATIAKWELRAALALGTGQWASHAWGCWVLGGDSRESIPGETFVHALVKLWCVVAGQPRDVSPARASSVKLIGRHSQPVKNGAPRPQVRPQEGAREEDGVMASPRRRRDRIQRRRKRTGAEEKRAAGERAGARERMRSGFEGTIRPGGEVETQAAHAAATHLGRTAGRTGWCAASHLAKRAGNRNGEPDSRLAAGGTVTWGAWCVWLARACVPARTVHGAAPAVVGALRCRRRPA